MAQSRRSLTLTPAERKGLLHAMRQPVGGVALRAAMVLWSAQGQSATSIARTLGVTPRTVYGGRQRWRVLRLEGLSDAPRSGRPSRVDADYLALLVRTVETDPRELGFAFARWTCARLAAYLKERTRVEVSVYWVGELLRCHGFAWRRAKLTTRHLADEAEKSARPKAPERTAETGLPGGGGLLTPSDSSAACGDREQSAASCCGRPPERTYPQWLSSARWELCGGRLDKGRPYRDRP